MSETRLMRSETDRMIAGVCGGLANYIGIDPVLVRLAFVILLLASGIGLAVYLVLWIVMPDASRVGELNGDEPYGDPNTLKAGTTMRTNTGRTAGIMLVGLGIFFLLNQLGWISQAFWPIVLILGGLYLIIRRRG